MQAVLFQKGKNASGKDPTLAKLLKSLMEVGGIGDCLAATTLRQGWRPAALRYKQATGLFA